MTDPEHDEVFEAYLKRRAVLPALDKGVEPPAGVDERVLAEAREAIQPRVPVQGVGGRPERFAAGATHAGDDSRDGHNVVPLAAAKPPMQRPPRWAVPVALAATVLLCLSVVINISLNKNRPSPNLERMTASRADTKASALANATAEADAAGGGPARAKSDAARDQLAESDGERRESVSGDIPSREVVLPRARVAGVAAPRAPVEAEGTAPGSVAASSGEARSGLSESVEARVAELKAAAPASPNGRSASAADKAVLFAKEVGVSAPGAPPMASAKAASPTATAASAAPALPNADVGDQPAAKAKPAAGAAGHPTDPKVWLQQIDALRAAGKNAQADAEMRRFKVAFPDYDGKAAAPASPDLPK